MCLHAWTLKDGTRQAEPGLQRDQSVSLYRWLRGLLFPWGAGCRGSRTLPQLQSSQEPSRAPGAPLQKLCPRIKQILIFGPNLKVLHSRGLKGLSTPQCSDHTPFPPQSLRLPFQTGAHKFCSQSLPRPKENPCFLPLHCRGFVGPEFTCFEICLQEYFLLVFRA